MADKFGYITQVIGPVVDVALKAEGNEVPPIYAALKIERENGAELIVEVEQHIGENTVRCVAMEFYRWTGTGYEGYRLCKDQVIDATGSASERSVDECHR